MDRDAGEGGGGGGGGGEGGREAGSEGVCKGRKEGWWEGRKRGPRDQRNNSVIILGDLKLIMKFKIRGVIGAARISLSPFSSGKIMRNPSLTDHLLKAQQQLRIHFKHSNCFVFRLCGH